MRKPQNVPNLLRVVPFLLCPMLILRPTQSVALLRCWYFKAYLKSNGTTQNKKYLAKCKLLNQPADLQFCFSYFLKKESIKINFKTRAESAKTQMKDEKQNANEWAPSNVPITILHSGVSQKRLQSNKFNYRTVNEMLGTPSNELNFCCNKSKKIYFGMLFTWEFTLTT